MPDFRPESCLLDNRILQQRLFEVLDTMQYGQAKIRDDPSMHSFARELDLGRQAAMWEGWTLEEGIALLPRLWKYTLLRCSLKSRADRFPEEAFRLLVLLGRKQEALGLAEMLTDLAKKVHALQHIAEQLRELSIEESEWLEILMRAGAVARTIQDHSERVEALSALGTALAQAQQWEQASQVWAEAERVIGTIPRSEQAEALRELGTALAQAQQWEQARRVIGTIRDSSKQARALWELGTALAQAQQWEQASQVWTEAERVIGTILDRSEQAEALSTLSTAMVSVDEFEQLLHVIQRTWHQVESREEALTLFPLASVFIPCKPQMAIAFFDAFTWVDTFLGG
jgi:tetratricopeptide (TPR) repeat protein